MDKKRQRMTKIIIIKRKILRTSKLFTKFVTMQYEYVPLRCYHPHLQPQRSADLSLPWQRGFDSRGYLGSSSLRLPRTLMSDEPGKAKNGVECNQSPAFETFLVKKFKIKRKNSHNLVEQLCSWTHPALLGERVESTSSPFWLINIDLFLSFSFTPVHLSPAHTQITRFVIFRRSWSPENVRTCLCTYLFQQLPDRGFFELRDQHPAAPGYQISLCGHLAARGVAVHLADSLDLPAAP